MIVIYIDQKAKRGEEYGFHVYRHGFIFDALLSRSGFSSRDAAKEAAIIVNTEKLYYPHEIVGG